MKSDWLKEIGIRISEKRKCEKYTQEKVAELMNVSIQMISNLERGNKAIKIENLIKLSEIFNISTDYILTGKHSDNDLNDLAHKLSNLSDNDYKTIEMLIDYYNNNIKQNEVI